MRSNTEQHSRLGPQNASDGWALGAGSGKEPQTDVHTLPGTAGGRMGFSQAFRAASPCCRRPPTYCRNGAGFTARVVPFVLRHTTRCRRAHRLSTRRPGPTLTNGSFREVSGRGRQLRPSE